MKILFLLNFAVLGMLTLSTADPIPDGLATLLNKHSQDSTISFGFVESKSIFKLDKLFSFKDIRVGTPTELFFVDGPKLESLSDTEAVEKFIRPLKRWEAPIWVNNRCIYTIQVRDRGQYWEFCGSSSCYPSSDGYDGLRKKWPENKDTNFVIIEYGNYTLLHFPKLNKHNLVFPYDELESIKFPTLNKTKPADSRGVISGLKKHYQARKEYWRKNPTFAPPEAFEEPKKEGSK
jgi:hypothetical protein